MNKFDKPYRLLLTYDQKKVLELFNLVNDLDTNELLKYSEIDKKENKEEGEEDKKEGEEEDEMSAELKKYVEELNN